MINGNDRSKEVTFLCTADWRCTCVILLADETGFCQWPSLRVVDVEDLCETLMDCTSRCFMECDHNGEILCRTWRPLA